MSIFYRSFTELFKTKIKMANLFIFIGLIGSLALTVFSAVNDQSLNRSNMSFIVLWLFYFFLMSFLLFIVFYCVTCVTHERINGNQTWRLIPLSSTSLYTDNMLSSFVSAFCFAIYEAIINVVFALVTMLADKKFYQSAINTIKDIQFSFNKLPSRDISYVIENITGILLLIILAGFFFYFLVDFLNFSSHSIADFIPGSRGRNYIRIIVIFLIVIAAWAIMGTNNFLREIIFFPLDFIFGSTSKSSFDLFAAILIMTSLDGIFLVINLLLYNKFFEAGQKN